MLLRRSVVRLATLCALALSTGCAGQRVYFRPIDNLVRVPGRGYLAIATYDLAGPDGAKVGTLRVDSQGIYEAELEAGNGRLRVLQIELTVTNTGRTPILLPRDQQRVVNLDGNPRLFPYRIFVDGAPTLEVAVPPGAAAQIDLLYRVPGETDLAGLEDFLFRWFTVIGSSERVEFTHFIRMPQTSYYYPAYAYAGYWNGYFFPGHFTIPDWGLGILFAPPVFPYYEEDLRGLGGSGEEGARPEPGD